jgi:hypothetical protein
MTKSSEKHTIFKKMVVLFCKLISDSIVLIIKKPALPLYSSDKTPIPNAQLIYEKTGGKLPKKPSQPSTLSTNLPNTLEELMGLLKEGPSTSSTANANPNPPQTKKIELDPNALQQLKDMGFVEERCKKALYLNRMNAQLAMEWLLEHDGDPSVDIPLTQQQIDQLTLVPVSSSSNPISSLISSLTGGSSNSSSFTPNPAIVDRLKALGFAIADINRVLQLTNNNEEAAIAILLGDTSVEDEEEEEEVDNRFQQIMSNPTIVSSLGNPRVLGG